jgi:hypothetical protein
VKINTNYIYLFPNDNPVYLDKLYKDYFNKSFPTFNLFVNFYKNALENYNCIIKSTKSEKYSGDINCFYYLAKQSEKNMKISGTKSFGNFPDKITDMKLISSNLISTELTNKIINNSTNDYSNNSNNIIELAILMKKIEKQNDEILYILHKHTGIFIND